MTVEQTNGLVIDLAGLRDGAGRQLGFTDWQEMTQERPSVGINRVSG